MSDEQAHPWTDCVAHPQHTDTDCDYCEAELDAKNKVMKQMERELMLLDKQLLQIVGIPFLATAPVVQATKIDVLVDMILSDPKHRMAYELNYGQRMKSVMMEAKEKAEETVRRQRLMANGAQAPGGLIIKGG